VVDLRLALCFSLGVIVGGEKRPEKFGIQITELKFAGKSFSV
jgi:hypothetical protein